MAPWALSLASIWAGPALLNAAGGGQVAITSSTLSCSSRGPSTASRAGRGLGVQASGPVGDLVDLAGWVQVEAGQHRQGCRVLIAGGDLAQGVRHGPGRLGDDLRVTSVGLGLSWGQVGDAPHRQARQVGHGDAHVLGDSDR